MKKLLLFLLIPVSLFGNPINTELGKPESHENLEIIERNEFTSGFNCEYGIPMWVSYNLNKDWYGDVPRWSGNFIVDSLLPTDCWVKHSDYTNSGYDRGHMVRSEERTRTVSENKASFRTSNIIPQLPELNQQTWLKLEYYVEKLAKDSLKEMYIFAGPIFTPGKAVTKYKDKIAIPDSCYKIVIIMPYGSKLNNVDFSTQVIAVIMPNNDKDVKNHDWTEYKTTIKNIEGSTGLNFLSLLPLEYRDALEGKTVSVGETKPLENLIFPNPATDFINVPAEKFTIYNSLGIEIGTFNQKTVDVSGFINGVYFVRFNNELLKFVK